MAQVHAVEDELETIQQERIQQGLPEQVDLILEFDSAPGFPLSADQIHNLTTSSAITLVHARPALTEEGRQFTRILLHVPYGSLPGLAAKIRRYGEELTDSGKIPSRWLANLQRLSRAAFEALWTDTEPLPVDDALHWWQLWVRRNNPPANLAAFEHFAASAGLELQAEPLRLPEHVVRIALATRAQLESSLDLLNTLGEVRAAKSCHYELTGLAGHEQAEWIDDAVTRINFPDESRPAVCILDTGVNRGHPLLAPLILEGDNHTIFPGGDASDGYPSSGGHGTLVAGLAGYTDLRHLMMSTGQWTQEHRLESVRIFDPNRRHEPQNYGAVTIQGVLTPEASAPTRKRTYAMAITADGNNDGRPSAWSAAIDSVAFGAEEEGEPKRLLFVSAGNFSGHDAAFRYPDHNQQKRVHDPAQAWNAVTVGALTHRHRILESDAESHVLTPIAQAGTLSPFSSTSLDWDPHWPIKPEIVMEGGNLARHSEHGPEHRDSLELLSTSAGFHHRPITTFCATSASVALAANLGARIQVAYPDLWPETVRALVVHSARWSDTMLGGLEPHQPYTKEQRARLIQLLRTYGFGEPHVARACFSSEQEVTLLRQDELTPYDGSSGSASIHDCHIHRLNLPANLLRELGATNCTMRVTLSYFTAPNPSSSNRIPGSRYRYGGCLLRFRVRHKDESEDDFVRLVSKEANDGDDLQEAPDSMHDRAWALGPQLRGKAGSVLHDVWQGNAADLASMDQVAVFPVKGWWASRSFPPGSPWHRCHKRTIRYSLIVSLEVMADVPLYTEISNLISVPLDAV